MAVSIKDSSAIAIWFSKQIVHLIFIAVSIRTAVPYSKKCSVNILIFMAVSYKGQQCCCYMLVH